MNLTISSLRAAMIPTFVHSNHEFYQAFSERSSRILSSSGDLCVGFLFLVVIHYVENEKVGKTTNCH